MNKTLPRPTGTKLLIERQLSKEKSDGGILLPEALRELSNIGIVRRIGHDVKDLIVGDSVIFDRFGATPLEVNGTEYLLVEQKSIVARFERE